MIRSVRVVGWVLIGLGVLGCIASGILYWAGGLEGLAESRVRLAHTLASRADKPDEVAAEARDLLRSWLYWGLFCGALVAVCGALMVLMPRLGGRSPLEPLSREQAPQGDPDGTPP
jgi:hypothetical protein